MKVNDLNDIKQSNGGTDPSCFVQFLNRQQCLVIYTDGQIGEKEMNKFRQAITGKIGEIPVIIGFAVASFDLSIERNRHVDSRNVPVALKRRDDSRHCAGKTPRADGEGLL